MRVLPDQWLYRCRNIASSSFPVIADPKLADPAKMVIPRWDDAKGEFLSGQKTIRAEFERIVKAHGAIPAGSPAVGAYQADGEKPTTRESSR